MPARPGGARLGTTLFYIGQMFRADLSSVALLALLTVHILAIYPLIVTTTADPCRLIFFFFFVTLGLELSDTKVYEPYIRADQCGASIGRHGSALVGMGMQTIPDAFRPFWNRGDHWPV